MKTRVLFALSENETNNMYLELCQIKLGVESSDFSCSVARSAEEVLQSISSDNYPQVVILDFALENGEYENCRKIKEEMEKRSPIVKPYLILLSMLNDEGGRQERKYYGKQNGANFVVEGVMDGVDILVDPLSCFISESQAQYELFYANQKNAELTLAVMKQKKELEEQNRKLELLSVQDPLTGAWNRRYLSENFGAFAADCRRNKKQMAMLAFDIDYFKSINDNYGHPTGDKVLRHFHELIRQNIRENDIWARTGGEEFTLLCSVNDNNDAVGLAQKLCQIVANNPLCLDEVIYESSVNCGKVEKVEKIDFTVSIGQIIVKEGENSSDAMSRVDELLYEAKENGRNRAVSEDHKSEDERLRERAKKAVLEVTGKRIAVDFRVA